MTINSDLGEFYESHEQSPVAILPMPNGTNKLKLTNSKPSQMSIPEFSRSSEDEEQLKIVIKLNGGLNQTTDL